MFVFFPFVLCLPCSSPLTSNHVIHSQIQREEKTKSDIQKKMQHLAEQLQQLNESLAEKQRMKEKFDTTIQETEAAYMKILESSQTLLMVLKREAGDLVKSGPTGTNINGPAS